MSRTYDGVEDLSPRQSELATSLRIPLITSPYPRWYYVTAVVVSEDLWFGHMPTDAELRMVGSFNDEYRERWYNDRWKAKMAAFAPFDIDGGAVGTYLIKQRHGGWGYRKHTWQYGPQFVPEWDGEPEDLPTVLDRIHTFVQGEEVRSSWTTWKADRPEVFGPIPAATS